MHRGVGDIGFQFTSTPLYLLGVYCITLTLSSPLLQCENNQKYLLTLNPERTTYILQEEYRGS